MKSTDLRLSSAIGFALWAIVTSSNAVAAEADTSAGGVLQEVVVTAQRREENVSRVPISISAFSQSDLESRDIKTLGDIASVTPGVDFRPVGYSNWFTIRGISQNAAAAWPDSVPTPPPSMWTTRRFRPAMPTPQFPPPFPMFSTSITSRCFAGRRARCSVRAPKAAQIRIISHAPSLTEFSGMMRAEGSSTDGGGLNTEMGAAVGGPIIQDVLGFRASVWTRHDGGFVDQDATLLGQPPANAIPRGQKPGELLPGIVNGYTDTNINRGDTYSARVAFLWKPTDAITIEPAIYYQEHKQNSADLFDPTIGNPSEGKFVSSRILQQPIDDKFYTPSLKATFDFAWAELTSTTTYLRRTDGQGYDYTLVLPPAFGWSLPTSCGGCRACDRGNEPEQLHAGIPGSSPPTSSEHFHWTLGVYYSDLHQHDFETRRRTHISGDDDGEFRYDDGGVLRRRAHTARQLDLCLGPIHRRQSRRRSSRTQTTTSASISRSLAVPATRTIRTATGRSPTVRWRVDPAT